MVLRKAYTRKKKTYTNKGTITVQKWTEIRVSDTAGADLICLINLLNKLKS